MRRAVPHKLSLASIHIYMYALRSCCQAIKRSAKQEENPLFTAPDRCRVIVPCEIVPGQITTTASRNLLFWQQFALLWKDFPFLTDRKSTRLNSSHGYISYAVFCLKKKKN